MKILWKYNENSTSECFEKTYLDIKRGFFQRNRFYVLPYLPTKFRDRVVFFPQLNQHPLRDSFQKYIQPFERRLIKLQSESKDIMPIFEGYCRNFISDKDYNIEIRPSYIGSVGTYEFKKMNKILLYPRFDRNIFEIYCLIVTAIIEFEHPKVKSDKQWRDKQKLTERIFSSESFRNIFPEVKDMTEILNENSTGLLAIKSSEYLRKVGYPMKSFIKGINQIGGLTLTEKAILSLFLKNRCKVITYDELAEELWGDEVVEKFSLAAISKVIERVRSKIYKSGIPVNLIDSQRGEGYVLHD